MAVPSSTSCTNCWLPCFAVHYSPWRYHQVQANGNWLDCFRHSTIRARCARWHCQGVIVLFCHICCNPYFCQFYIYSLLYVIRWFSCILVFVLKSQLLIYILIFIQIILIVLIILGIETKFHFSYFFYGKRLKLVRFNCDIQLVL